MAPSPVRWIARAGAPIDAVVRVPGSKSIANRALVCAALAAGRSTLRNVPDGDDTVAMAACLRRLGAGVQVDGDAAVVVGRGPRFDRPASLHAGLAGTTSRFVTALAALGSAAITVDGDPPLRRRPFGPLLDALAALGVSVTPGERPGTLPVIVQGPPRTGRASVRGDVSSQYVTALMLVGPYLPGGLELALTSELVSRPYVELTAAVMRWFGVDAVGVGADRIAVAPGAYRPADVGIEPDASSASYPLALAAVTGGAVEVPGLGRSLQGDARFPALLAEMGCEVTWTAGGVRVGRAPGAPLRGLDVDMAAVSDLVPTLAAVALFAGTPTRIRGVGFIRAKESDRLGDLAGELRKLGADVEPTGDGLTIRPAPAPLHGARLATHHDHRLAMAFAVAGAAIGGVEVEDPGVVSKSWPGFWTAFEGALE